MSEPVKRADVLIIRLSNGHVNKMSWRDPNGNELAALCKIVVICDCDDCRLEREEAA